MYVTEILSGRPYQCFIPQPLIPAIDASTCKRFAALDRLLKTEPGVEPLTEVFLSKAADFVAQTRHKADAGDRLAQARKSIENLLSRKRIGIEQVKALNAALGGNGEFRKISVWMGAPHPALSWHVGSPPGRLNGLVKNLVLLPESGMPSSLQAVIGLIRLLQIHPFADGNGRTARAYALWLGYRAIGPSEAFVARMDALCDRRRFDLNAASLQAQNSGSFESILDRMLEAGGSD